MDAKARAKFINSVAGGQSICCPQCAAINDPGSKFCFSCGFPLTQTFAQPVKEKEIYCPKCRAMNEVGSKFCFSCGTKIEQDVIRGDAASKGKPPIPKIENKPDVKIVTGEKRVSETDHVPKIETVSKTEKKSMAVPMPKTGNVPIPEADVNEKPESVFAEGLPSWNIEPPVIMVRRKRTR